MSKDMIKDTDEYPDGRDAQGKVSGEGRRAPMSSPGMPLSWHPHMVTNPEALWTPILLGFYSGFIT